MTSESHSFIRGSIVAIVTPMKDGKLDERAFGDLVEWHVSEGTSGIVPVGTTGESPTVTPAEHLRVVEMTISAAAGRVPVIAGAGSNNTQEAVHYLKEAERLGADAGLAVTPYYNKPTQEGLFRHFEAMATSSDLPIFLYNIPGRSVIDMSIETMARLAALPTIVGLKDATGDLARVALQRLACGDDFIQLSGEDATALAFNASGGVGCISVTANVAPKLCAEFQAACLAGDYLRAQELDLRLAPLHRALFLESSPGPTKWALSLLGKIDPELRLPLCEISDPTKQAVQRALAQLGLLD